MIVAQAGCFLPALMMFNLLFGWLIFNPLAWIGIELVLFLAFILSSYIFARSIVSSRRRSEVIDVEAEVIEESPRLK